MTRSSSPSKMRGLSLVGWILVIFVVVIFATAAIKMIPAYLDFSTINGTISNVLADSRVGLKSDDEIRSDIDKRFTINRVEVIRADDLLIEREGGTLKVILDYEVREKLFSNVDVVMVFNREYSKDIR